MLKDKVAVIYGAGGAIGGAVARAFAPRAPGCFSPGATCAVEAVAKESCRRRIRRGGGGRRTRRAGMDEHLQVRDRRGGPHRHLVRRDRDPEREDPRCPAGRSRRRAVLAADRDLRQVVLPDRTPGGPAHDREQVGGDHDRHRVHSRRGSRWWEATARRWPRRRRSRAICPPSSLLTAFAWSVCGHRPCRRRRRSRTRSSRAPRRRA